MLYVWELFKARSTPDKRCCMVIANLVSAIAIMNLFALTNYRRPIICWIICFIPIVRLSFQYWIGHIQKTRDSHFWMPHRIITISRYYPNMGTWRWRSWRHFSCHKVYSDMKWNIIQKKTHFFLNSLVQKGLKWRQEELKIILLNISEPFILFYFIFLINYILIS
jgi:hypothetical protein